MGRRRLPLLAGAVGISALGDMVAVVPVALHPAGADAPRELVR
jgi:hypothetical protein